MSDPRPLRSLREGPEAALGEALQEVERAYCWPADREAAAYWGFRALLQARRRRRRRAVRAGAAAGLGAAVLALVLTASPSSPRERAPAALAGPGTSATAPWTPLVLGGDVGVMEVSPFAEVEIEELEAERRIVLRSGILRAQVARQDPRRPVNIVTPHLRIVVVGTRLDVRVGPATTSVHVLQGAVQVESPRASILLSGGASCDSDDPRFDPPLPEAMAPPAREAAVRSLAEANPARDWGPRAGRRRAEPGSVAGRMARRGAPGSPLERCERLAPLAERERCLRGLARGAGLTAQNALYALGLVAQQRDDGAVEALRAFGEYERRFPDGPLAVEAGLRRFEILRDRDQFEAAVTVAASIEARFPGDPRIPELTLSRAALLCRIPGRQREALELLEPLQGGPETELSGRARELGRQCGNE